MIRFDDRSIDVLGTERVFKKVVHPGQNSLKLVDRDGIPLRAPNSAAVGRQQSSYVLSSRGVPTKKTTHSYSGQLTQGKMHPLASSCDSQDMSFSPNSMNAYNLGSAGSSRQYMPVNLQSSKKRTFGSGPPRTFKTMAKSASSERSSRVLSTDDGFSTSPDDQDRWNSSLQGKRLEKEWSALSQCRALKRSSEIVSHRVDRMYFMTGNTLRLQQKYHVADEDFQKLKELQQARASSRHSRTSSRVKEDIYRQNRSARSTKSGRSEPDSVSHPVNGVGEDGDKSKVKRKGSDGLKDIMGPSSNIMVTQKVLTPKPTGQKSPLQGWASEAGSGHGTPSESNMLQDRSLHEDNDAGDVEVVSVNDGTSQSAAEPNTGDQQGSVTRDPDQPAVQEGTNSDSLKPLPDTAQEAELKNSDGQGSSGGNREPSEAVEGVQTREGTPDKVKVEEQSQEAVSRDEGTEESQEAT